MGQELTKQEILAPMHDDGGFELGAQNTRVIVGRILKQIDGRTTVEMNPFPDDRPLAAQRVAQVAQCWVGQQLIDFAFHSAEHPVNVDELNSRMPKPWEIGLDGQPRPPWALNCVVYFVDETDGSQYTMINSTVGMRRAFEELCQKVTVMRKLRGPHVVPIVTVGSAPMKTHWGQKMRPDFRIVGWKGLAAEQPLLKPVAPPSTAELIDDELPGTPAPKIAAKPAAPKAAPQGKRGRCAVG